MKELKMDSLSNEQRKLMVETYSAGELIIGKVARRLVMLPMSPHDLSHLVDVASPYLHNVGQRALIVEDVEGGLASRLVITSDLSAVTGGKESEDEIIQLENDKLRVSLKAWDDSLVGAGFMVVSSDEMVEFLEEVDSVVSR